jgi:hypothetical protein
MIHFLQIHILKFKKYTVLLRFLNAGDVMKQGSLWLGVGPGHVGLGGGTLGQVLRLLTCPLGFWRERLVGQY